LEQHSNWILALLAEQSDLTLDGIASTMHKERIRGARIALWRFFARHGITVNTCTLQRADVPRAMSTLIQKQAFLDPARLVFTAMRPQSAPTRYDRTTEAHAENA
jgi:hypothetical protein